jgi:hypothetical protein
MRSIQMESPYSLMDIHLPTHAQNTVKVYGGEKHSNFA